MTLYEIDITTRDWKDIRPQLDQHSYYIIKYMNNNMIVLFCSLILPAAWTIGNDIIDLDLPHAWRFSQGLYYKSFSPTTKAYMIDDNIISITKIHDRDVMKQKAKWYLM
jgi:hypothetical protein